MNLAIGYLAVSGAWTWLGLWWTIISNGSVVGEFLRPLMAGFGISIASLLGAYLLYRGSRYGIASVAAVPVMRWLAFALTFPSQGAANDFIVDADFILRLPPMLLGGLVVDLLIAVYSGFLWRYGRLR